MSSTTSCGVGTKMTSGPRKGAFFCACASRAVGAARASAAASAIRVFMREIMLWRKAGREAVRSHVLFQLSLLGGLGYAGRVLIQRRFYVRGPMNLEARPCNQQDGGNDGEHREDRGDRMLAVRRGRLEIFVRAGMAHTA